MTYVECCKDDIMEFGYRQPVIPFNKTDIINRKISTILVQLGILPNNTGFRYLKDAIKIALEDDESILFITKIMYPKISKIYSVHCSQVERCIRYAISKIKADDAQKSTYLGIPKKHYTNKEFISVIAEYIRLN